MLRTRQLIVYKIFPCLMAVVMAFFLLLPAAVMGGSLGDAYPSLKNEFSPFFERMKEELMNRGVAEDEVDNKIETWLDDLDAKLQLETISEDNFSSKILNASLELMIEDSDRDVSAAFITILSDDYDIQISDLQDIIDGEGQLPAELQDFYDAIKTVMLSYSATVAPPTASPEAGTYAAAQNVTLTAQEGAAIYYTTDGSDPTTNSTQYTQQINVSSSSIVKAIAVKNNVTSSIATFEYTISRGGGGSGGGTTTVVTTTPAASTDGVLTAANIQAAISANPAATVITTSIEFKDGQAGLLLETKSIEAINQDGKDLAVTAGNVTVTLPALAVSQETIEELAQGAADAGVRLSITESDKSGAGSFMVKGLSCAKVLDFSMAVEAAGQIKGQIEKFDKPVTISIKLTPEEIAGLNPQLLGVYYLNPATGEAEYMGGTYNAASGVMTFSTGHFSNFAVMEYKKAYADVSVSHWAYNDIQIMGAKHIMGGVSESNFAPDDNVTRAQFAAMLVRALNLPATDSTLAFKDVTADKWYYKDIAAAYGAGLISGYDAATFGPEDTITREQIASMLIRALNKLGKAPALTQDEANTILAAYKDKDSIDDWAVTSSAAAVKVGLVKGRTADTFAPLATATRAEGAALLKRFMQAGGLM